ncbi:uncharacterized protein OCT59_011779 [Rhizophagus irregularis]|uniref:uncharacterized protein n=1 Tax=Rhizophagus irregularis TaxID=588596 RepID=UPI0033306576|nr:hypothetical protein OCT59_011779 [Rhizophagus irregularis]
MIYLLLSHLILTKQINSKTRLEKSRYDDKVIHSTKPSSITSNIYSHFMINPFSNYWINLNLSSTNSLNFFWRISMSSRSSSIFMRVGRVGEFEAKKYNVLRSNSIKHNDAKDNNNKYSHDLDLEFFFRILLIEHMMFSSLVFDMFSSSSVDGMEGRKVWEEEIIVSWFFVSVSLSSCLE